jgi:hypothetical protein
MTLRRVTAAAKDLLDKSLHLFLLRPHLFSLGHY